MILKPSLNKERENYHMIKRKNLKVKNKSTEKEQTLPCTIVDK